MKMRPAMTCAALAVLLTLVPTASATPSDPGLNLNCPDGENHVAICVSVPLFKQYVTQMLYDTVEQTLDDLEDLLAYLQETCPGPGGVQQIVDNCAAVGGPWVDFILATVDEILADIDALKEMVLEILEELPETIDWLVEVAIQTALAVKALVEDEADALLRYAGVLADYAGDVQGTWTVYAGELASYAGNHVDGPCGPFSPCTPPSPPTVSPPPTP